MTDGFLLHLILILMGFLMGFLVGSGIRRIVLEKLNRKILGEE